MNTTAAPAALRPAVAAPVKLRAIRSADAAMFGDFVRALSPQSKRLRFHAAVSELPAAALVRLATPDARHEIAAIATVEDDLGERCIGEARSAAVDDAPDTHEFGLAVADDRRRRGLGGALLERLLCLARRAGVRWLRGDVLRENLPMLALARRLGFAIARHPCDATLLRVMRATTTPAQPGWICD
jgi:acetyltransferase